MWFVKKKIEKKKDTKLKICEAPASIPTLEKLIERLFKFMNED